MSNNFVNNAIMGEYISNNIGQFEFWDDFMEWWENLEDMIKYAMVAGVGLIAIVLVISMFKPAVVTGVERLEELLRLKMMAELSES